jgi:hypothetical protein
MSASFCLMGSVAFVTPLTAQRMNLIGFIFQLVVLVLPAIQPRKENGSEH